MKGHTGVYKRTEEMKTGKYIRSLIHIENMSKGMKGKNIGPISEEHRKNLIMNHKGMLGKHHKEESKIKSSKSNKISQNKPEVKEKKRNATIKYLSNSKYDHNHISKPEKIMYDVLKKKFKNVIREHPIGGFCVVDDYLPDYNLVIEVYGNYPHANPKMYKAEDGIYKRSAKEVWEKDKERIKRIKKLGYKVLIFWEDEIYNGIERCMKKIKL